MLFSKPVEMVEQVSLVDENKFKTAILMVLQKLTKKEIGQCKYTLERFVIIIRKCLRNLDQMLVLIRLVTKVKWLAPLNALLDAFEQEDSLPKTILYNLNPIYNELIGTTIQNFQAESGIAGKIQFGSGWWFNDTKPGMIRQLTALADQGLLMHFVGMLTDSRSFISYSRHEYFRRILCNLVGTWVEDGEIPNDPALLQTMS